MKRQLVAAMLSLSMAMTMVPAAAAAEVSEVEDNTGGQEVDEDLEAAKTAAKGNLGVYWGDQGEKSADFDSAGKDAIKAIRQEGNTAIDAAADESKVNEALEAAKSKINDVPTIAEKLEAAKDEYDLTDYWGKNGEEAAEADDYDDTVKTEIGEIRDAFDTAKDNAESAAELEELYDDAIAEIDAKDTIAEHKAAVKAEIEAYFPEGINGLDDYDEDEQTEITTAKSEAAEAVDADTVNADMDTELADLKDKVDAVETSAEKALAAAKTAAKAELTAYHPDGKEITNDNYTTTQQGQIDDCKTAGATAIDEAGTIAEVNAALADAKTAINAVPTKTQLGESAEAVIAQIEAIGNVNGSNYNEKYSLIKAAEDSYDELEGGEDGQDKVTNIDDLTKARKKYDSYKCLELEDAIESLGIVNAENYIDKKEDIDSIEAELAKVGDDSSISESKTAFTTAKAAYEAAAEAVSDFEALVESDLASIETVAYTDKTAIEGAKTAYEALTDAQKSQISADTMTVYTAAAETIAAFDKAIDDVKALIAGLPGSITGTAEDKAALDEAREAYEAITDTDAQDAVDTLDDLQTKEAAYVTALIDAIGSTAPVTNDVIEKTSAAREALDALDATAAGKVAADKKSALEAAETAVEDYNEALKQATQNTAAAAFKAVEDVTKVTVDNKADVEAAINAYNELQALEGDVSAYEERFDQLAEMLKTYEAESKAQEDALNLAKATVSAANQTYTGKALQPQVKVTDSAGAAVAAKDYTIIYQNNVNAGNAKVVVVAVNGSQYKGYAETTFRITAKAFEKASVSGIAEKTYTGKALTQNVTVKDSETTLADGVDYTVSYKNNKDVGKATVTITAKGNYTGSISKSFVIKPGKGAIKSVKAGKKKLTVKAKAQSGAKYQIAYKVKGAKKYKTVKTSSVTKTIKKLKKGKKYVVKVRAYKSIDGKVYYGGYSQTKTVKVK